MVSLYLSITLDNPSQLEPSMHRRQEAEEKGVQKRRRRGGMMRRKRNGRRALRRIMWSQQAPLPRQAVWISVPPQSSAESPIIHINVDAETPYIFTMATQIYCNTGKSLITLPAVPLVSVLGWGGEWGGLCCFHGQLCSP